MLVAVSKRHLSHPPVLEKKSNASVRNQNAAVLNGPEENFNPNAIQFACVSSICAGFFSRLDYPKKTLYRQMDLANRLFLLLLRLVGLALLFSHPSFGIY